MNKEKMNQALSMLDDDVIADALEGKKRSTGGVTRRKLMVTLIAATLAVTQSFLAKPDSLLRLTISEADMHPSEI